MKRSALLISLIFLTTCNPHPQTKSDSMRQSNKNKYAAELINNGFLRYADSSRLGSLKTQLMDSFDIYNDDNLKIVDIDAEELAEFNFEFFLPQLNRMLVARGIKLSARKLNDKENSFDALINSDIVHLYTQKELDDNTFWDTAPRNFFRKLNQILKTKNKDEKFYLLYSGNDLHAMFLTEKQLSIIAAYYKDKPTEIPYIP